MREPDFSNLLAVLNRRCPSRPTLFEFGFNWRIFERFLDRPATQSMDILDRFRLKIEAWKNGGYDYAMIVGAEITGPWRLGGGHEKKETISLNEGSVISNRATFDEYPWPDPDAADYSPLAAIAPDLPAGMKLVMRGSCCVLETVISLVGFDALCYMIADDPLLVTDIFEAVGSRLARYYEHCARFDTVGALVIADDWGFKTATTLSPADLRRFVFPWHKKIVETAHQAGKPAILHSCGNLQEVMDDIVNDMQYDGKHSYEDAICPVEDAYEQWHEKIAILGGIDVDFVVRSSPEEVHARSSAMLQRTADRGSYALGTGNSVPLYIPDENYLAMISAALGEIPQEEKT